MRFNVGTIKEDKFLYFLMRLEALRGFWQISRQLYTFYVDKASAFFDKYVSYFD